MPTTIMKTPKLSMQLPTKRIQWLIADSKADRYPLLMFVSSDRPPSMRLRTGGDHKGPFQRRRRLTLHTPDRSQCRRASPAFTRLTGGGAGRNTCAPPRCNPSCAGHFRTDAPRLQRITNRTIVSSKHAPMKALITERTKPAPRWIPSSGSR